MTIPAADVKQLWGRAASTCSMCRHKLEGVSLEGKAVVVGEAAHIVAGNKKGPRGCSILVDAERNSYFNLILLCPTCHTTIDKDPIGYPIERLYILKSQHEMRVRGEMDWALVSVIDSNEENVDVAAIVAFVSGWKEFTNFYLEFYIRVQSELKDDSIFLHENDVFMGHVRKWHVLRDELKELLFNAVEKNLIVRAIPDWNRLKLEFKYIQEGGYDTPFSYMLDFVNPMAMVNLHGDPLWSAMHISFEYCDFLSYKHPDVKSVWKRT
ncbi:HNH endonuclease [Granulosicoccus antarcticus]|uniref:HNH nuclease domain-containing protein n=1 Tax=Granulosicoccus antarcticus IMCC3135 TaxID=1192854 RepID=A0A2Z2NQ67_9GAMM|nr:HNH endonuclease [Granulosicoccus antarcticus]ASJ72111.1 hypothetical protein IMCC3135_10085 [Granulosicoccus antarcticus IMCC3135]